MADHNEKKKKMKTKRKIKRQKNHTAYYAKQADMNKRRKKMSVFYILLSECTYISYLQEQFHLKLFG